MESLNASALACGAAATPASELCVGFAATAFVAAEAIKGATRQICQPQVAVADILFQIGAERFCLRGILFRFWTQEQSRALGDTCNSNDDGT
jgi:hypothetical protein